jgi:hypothetical protein
MTELYAVKRVEAQGLLTDLKNFAFEESPGLKDGFDSGVEVTKTYIHDDPVPEAVYHKLGREMCSTTLNFALFRTPPVRNKRSFSYQLSARIDRTLPVISNHKLLLISPSIREAYDDFIEMEEGVARETSSIEFETSDHELREISVESEYRLSYAGDILFQANNKEILYGIEGEAAKIDPSESEDGLEVHFIPTAIKHEQLPPADNVIANIGFWAIVEPFHTDFEQGVNYRSAADQMRAIMHGIRTGELF